MSERNKVLVLGDSGVGKSSLVHLICHGKAISSASWTVGASIEVKLHEYAQGTPHQRSTSIEFWDIGGSKNHFNARRIFYREFNGIILVYDKGNRKSHDNLRKWLSEIFCDSDHSKVPMDFFHWLASMFFGAPPSFERIDFDPQVFTCKNIPLLVVATEADAGKHSSLVRISSSIAQDCSADEIFIDCSNPRSFAPGSTNAVILSRFLDRVIERKCNKMTGFTSSFMLEDETRMRNRLNQVSIAFHD